MDKEKLSGYIKRIEELTKKPEKYLSSDAAQVNLVRVLTKNLYDFTKEKEQPKIKTVDALKKLVITNLDEEQVWQQIELQNNSICDKFVNEIAYLSAKKDTLKFPLKEEKANVKNKEIKVQEKNIQNEVVENKVKKKVKSSKGKSSIVDDKFFKLHEMENFLEVIEKNEGKKVYDDDDDDDDDEEEEDLEDDSTLSDDNEKGLYYNDFFDQPDDEENEASFDKDEENGEKRVKFMLNGEENEDEAENSDVIESLDNFDDCDEEDNENEMPNDDVEDHYNDNDESVESDMEEEKHINSSSFEARQERLKSRIKNLEEEALKEKPWQLKGEVTAHSRPQNSLLEEYVEFDIAARPAPVLTEKSTLKLEDVIIQRIKDLAWDDVVRKIKPIENDIEYKKKLVLDQEKSKLSLAQIYEKEYLKQLESKNEEVIDKPEKEPPEHQEIRNMMNNLFSKLDALSNFHFTPKLVAPEVKVISNLPAINMEEVAPVATSDAALLAPEEVKPKLKGDLIGKSERTKTDKKRERRQRKLKQKLKHKQEEAKAKLQLENSKAKDTENKKVSQKFLQKITKSSNISQLDETGGGKYVKSSNAFFSKLQDETKSLIKKGLDAKKVKVNMKNKSKKSAAR